LTNRCVMIDQFKQFRL